MPTILNLQLTKDTYISYPEHSCHSAPLVHLLDYDDQCHTSPCQLMKYTFWVQIQFAQCIQRGVLGGNTLSSNTNLLLPRESPVYSLVPSANSDKIIVFSFSFFLYITQVAPSRLRLAGRQAGRGADEATSKSRSSLVEDTFTYSKLRDLSPRQHTLDVNLSGKSL